MGTLQAQLDYLYDLKAALSVIEMDKQAVIDTVLTPEIREKLAEIDTEFSFQKKAVQDSIDQAEIEIKEAVKEAGETIRGKFLMAVYNKGRVSWDTKSLDGYAAAHPEVAQFRKVGDPSISIRTIQ